MSELLNGLMRVANSSHAVVWFFGIIAGAALVRLIVAARQRGKLLVDAQHFKRLLLAIKTVGVRGRAREFHDQECFHVWPDGVVAHEDEPMPEDKSVDFVVVHAYTEAEALQSAVSQPDIAGYRVNNASTVAVATRVQWLPMEECPVRVKVQLVGAGGVAVYGEFDGNDPFWRGWAPLPFIPPWLIDKINL